MRAWLALPMLLLVAAPALAGVALPGCDAETDPARLPPVGMTLEQLLAAGWRLEPLIAPVVPGQEPAEDFHGCGGIRPGTRLVINGAWQCTANFVYRDEVGALYLGTAGHCGVAGDSVAVPGVGRIGDIAYSTGNGGVGHDFLLVRIYPQHYGLVRSTMCHWGGPTAIAEDENYGLAPVPLLHYGHGVLWGETPVTRPRAGAIHDLTVGTRDFDFVGTIAPGDSGSGIQFATGHAVGVITHGLIAPGANVGVVLGLGTRVQHGINLAEAATGHQFQVVYGQPVDLTGATVT